MLKYTISSNMDVHQDHLAWQQRLGQEYNAFKNYERTNMNEMMKSISGRMYQYPSCQTSALMQKGAYRAHLRGTSDQFYPGSPARPKNYQDSYKDVFPSIYRKTSQGAEFKDYVLDKYD